MVRCGAGRQRAGEGDHGAGCRCSQASTPTGSLGWGRDAGKVRGGDAGVVVDEAYRGNQWVCGRGHGLGLYAVIATATNTSMLALAEDQEC